MSKPEINYPRDPKVLARALFAAGKIDFKKLKKSSKSDDKSAEESKAENAKK